MMDVHHGHQDQLAGDLVVQTGPTESKSDAAYAWIKAQIGGHRFGPGFRLVLGPIADELGMSVAPVREAIRRLEAEGLVTFERNVGARVAVVDESEFADTMQTLGVVEGAATALSAPHLSAQDLARAAAINQQLQQLLTHFDPYTFTVVNQQFHTVLFQRCPNPQILELVQRGWSRLDGLRESTFWAVPARAEHSVVEHTELVELIGSRADPMEIELAARQHRWRTLQAYLDARHPAPPDQPSPDQPSPDQPSPDHPSPDHRQPALEAP